MIAIRASLARGLAGCAFGALALAGCADQVEDEPVEAYPTEALDDVGTTDPAAEVIGSDGNVPSIAEVQLALAQCQEAPEVVDAQCTAEADGASFTCRYALEGDTPETQRQSIIAARGDGYALVDIPEDCTVE